MQTIARRLLDVANTLGLGFKKVVVKAANGQAPHVHAKEHTRLAKRHDPRFKPNKSLIVSRNIMCNIQRGPDGKFYLHSPKDGDATRKYVRVLWNRHTTEVLLTAD